MLELVEMKVFRDREKIIQQPPLYILIDMTMIISATSRSSDTPTSPSPKRFLQ